MRGVYTLIVFVLYYIHFGSAGSVGLHGMANHLYNAANEVEPGIQKIARTIHNILSNVQNADGTVNAVADQDDMTYLATNAADTVQGIEAALSFLVRSLRKRIGTNVTASKSIYIPDTVIKRFISYMNGVNDKIEHIILGIKTFSQEFSHLNNSMINSLELETLPGNTLQTLKSQFLEISHYIRKVGFIFQETSAYLQEFEDITSGGEQNAFAIFYNALASSFGTIANNLSKHMNQFYRTIKSVNSSNGGQIINAASIYTSFNILLKYFEAQADSAVHFLNIGKQLLTEIFNE